LTHNLRVLMGSGAFTIPQEQVFGVLVRGTEASADFRNLRPERKAS
jgi:hypothetical protein